MPKKIKVGCYYFPNYHGCDERNAVSHGSGWCEWELVKAAHPRFPGHNQPKRPLWGYEDESMPIVMKRKICVAQEHGIDYFIFDYYITTTAHFYRIVWMTAFYPLFPGSRSNLH